MRYAVIMAGGSGTRLWPMSRTELPKQLIPFLNGRSLLEVAYDRFEGLIPAEQRYICAARKHQEVICSALSSLSDSRFLGEPVGRDTLAAVGFAAAAIRASDPKAVIGVFTSDHIIEPVADFRKIITAGFELAEQQSNTLVTFGITPTEATTAYGYLELGDAVSDSARIVNTFHEKPNQQLAEEYFRQGPQKFLWNSGMFVWRAQTLLDCIHRFVPEVAAGLQEIATAWGSSAQAEVLERVFPTLKKTSVDYGVMEPASRDEAVQVAAVPMQLDWLDIGSWPAFARTQPSDADGNALGAKQHLMQDSSSCVVASSDPEHLIALIGCEDLIVVHTDNATLICPAEKAEQIKQMHQAVNEKFEGRYT